MLRLPSFDESRRTEPRPRGSGPTLVRVHETLGGLRTIEALRDLPRAVNMIRAPSASERVRTLLVCLLRPRAGAWGSENRPPIVSCTRFSVSLPNGRNSVEPFPVTLPHGRGSDKMVEARIRSNGTATLRARL